MRDEILLIGLDLDHGIGKISYEAKGQCHDQNSPPFLHHNSGGVLQVAADGRGALLNIPFPLAPGPSLLRGIKNGHIDKECGKIAHDQANDAGPAEVLDHGHRRTEQGEKAGFGNQQGDDYRQSHIVYGIDRSFKGTQSTGALLMHPVMELNGIVYSDSYEYRKGSKRDHGHGYMQQAHGSKCPDYS